MISGQATVGKTTFIAYCREYLTEFGYYSEDVSSVDRVKDAALLLGWDGIKNDHGGPEDGGACALQRDAPFDMPGSDRCQKGRRRPGLGGRRDGRAVSAPG